MNGDDEDSPDRALPKDGKYTWIHGGERDGLIYGELQEDGNYAYEMRYDEGPGDRAWMEERDRKYVFRLEREGRLDQVEPNLCTEVPKLYEEVMKYRAERGAGVEAKAKTKSQRKAEAERKKKEEEAARIEAERKRKAEADRIEAERKRKAEADRTEAEKQARLRAQEKARKEEEAKRRPQKEARKKEDAEKKKKEEAERLERERLEEERIQKELADAEKEIEKLRRQKKLEELKREKEKLKSELQKPTHPTIVPSQDKKETNSLDQSYLIPYQELEFGAELGQGGFGAVFQGQWQYSPVAIKKLYLNKLSDCALQDFKEEASVMTKLHHINVITLYGVSIDRPGHYSLVIEYMPKGSLSDLLRSHNPLSWDLRYRISMDVCAGLLHLHKKNILHRDLKSMNVLLDENMRAKLSDFGLSKLRSETTATATLGAGSAVGTVSWMAPELFKRKGKYNKSSDVYSLGMVFWEIASRMLPFQDALNSDQIIAWKKGGDHEDIPEECPNKYGDMIKACWKVQDERPSVELLIRSLEKIFNPQQGEAAQSIHQSGPVYQFETKKNVEQSGPVYQM